MEMSLIRSWRPRVTQSFLVLALSFASIVATGCSKTEPTATGSPAPGQRTGSHPVLVFMTDFGTANDAVAICKAVMLGIAPDVRIMDITHQVTPYSIEEGARLLAGGTPYYPLGAVFVGGSGPRVGTNRERGVGGHKK